MDVGSFAEFSHIGQEEDVFLVFFKLLCNHLELFSCIETLWKDHICSGINVSLGSVDALIEADDSLSISSCTDYKLPI